MIKVSYERYWNDFIRKSEEKDFPNLATLAEWIFGQMQQGFTQDFVYTLHAREDVDADA